MRHQGCEERSRGRPTAGFTHSAMAAGVIALLVLSCGDGAVEPIPPPPAPVATTVTVNPGSAALSALGETARFTAEVRDQNGRVMAGAAVVWASSDASVASVDASGLVTAAANGSATITATAGSVSGTAAVTVTQVASAVAVSPSADTLVAFGDTVRLVAEATDANGHAVAGSQFAWSSSDTLVARVDDSGLVTGMGVGKAEVTATTSGINGRAVLTVVENPDRAALVALYGATTIGLRSWDIDTNWLSDQPLGTWYGVTTGEGGRVIELNLANNNLRESIPPELGNLEKLKKLDLSDNGIEGILSAEIGNLRNLEELHLQGNGQLGYSSTYSIFHGWTRTWYTIPAELGQLDKLESLNLSGTDFDGPIPRELGDLRSLTWLHLADLNYLDGPMPPELGQLSNLRHLDLSGSGLEGSVPSELGQLSNLRHLDLSVSGLDGVLPQVLVKLRLDLFHWNGTRLCSPENSAFVEWLAGITDHEGLTCGQLSDRTALTSFFSSTRGADYWDINTNWLSDEPLGVWYGVTTDNDGRVIELRLPDNSLYGRIPSNMDLPKLKRLDLSGNRIYSVLPPGIGDLRDLEELNLSDNFNLGTGRPIPSEIGKLDKLQLLNLSETHFEGAIPREFGNLRNLTRLELVDVWDLGGPIPAELGQLSKLEHLDLSDSGLEGSIPAELGQLASLRHLDLSRNYLDDSIPSEFGRLSNLRHLDVEYSGLGGALPQQLINVPLALFHWNYTRLCSPDNQEFQAWLRRIADHRGRSTCGSTSAAGRRQ
ncbi:MAG: hypothetical protein F4X15_08200 [Gemmatimonadetes bacterium]|nr:hypothetical protein [Gemmatimonadota bacterium]MYC91434.1 hypothetical protein [Gemmatimonadota bacterium]